MERENINFYRFSKKQNVGEDIIILNIVDANEQIFCCATSLQDEILALGLANGTVIFQTLKSQSYSLDIVLI